MNAADGEKPRSGVWRTIRSRSLASLRDPAFPAALAIIALLLFSWPFVRVPRLPLAHAWGHLFASWALAIAALFALSRALARRRGPDRG
jgi:hypothetical protein